MHASTALMLVFMCGVTVGHVLGPTDLLFEEPA